MDDERVPPGHYDVGDAWPVLTAEVTPKLSTSSWSFIVEGLVERPTTWTWDEIRALEPSVYNGDIHCVTAWSKFGVTFTGVSVDTLLEVAAPAKTATHVVAFGHTGYTTNLPLADVWGGKAWVVWEHDGQPLAVEQGKLPSHLPREVPQGLSGDRRPLARSAPCRAIDHGPPAPRQVTRECHGGDPRRPMRRWRHERQQ